MKRGKWLLCDFQEGKHQHQPAMAKEMNRSQCCSSSGVIVRIQGVREGSHTEGTMWYVLNYLHANVVEKVTTVRTLHNQ